MTNPYKITPLAQAYGDDQWDHHCAVLQQPTLFHTSDWLRFVESHFGIHLHRALVRRGEEVVGLFPYFRKRYFLLTVIGSPLFAENNPYMGLVLDGSCDTPRVIEAFEMFLRQNSVDFLRMSLDSDVLRPYFQEAGYAIKERKSFRLDLRQDEEVLWKNIGSRGRNKVRKAENHGFAFARMSGESYENYYYDMSINVYGRQKIPPILGKEYYRRLYGAFHDRDCFHLFSVNDEDGKPAAAAIILTHREKAYYLDGVSYREFQTFGANNFLQWNIIATLKEMGIANYDMLGGDIGGIAQFKKSFGTRNSPCIYVEKPLSPLALLSKRSYSKIKTMKTKIAYYAQILKG